MKDDKFSVVGRDEQPDVNGSGGLADDVSRAKAPESGPPDPFDPDSLRLSQDFASSIGVKRVLTVVPCHKPNRYDFVRVRPDEDWRLETGIFEDKANREFYLVSRDLWSDLEGDIQSTCLFLAVTRQGNIFLWPVKLAGADGKTNAWNESSQAAARLAEESWIRLASNMNAGYYDTVVATVKLPEPEWPDLSLTQILRLCFKTRFIESVDHPILQALRGEV
jgi:hypothetical protein